MFKKNLTITALVSLILITLFSGCAPLNETDISEIPISALDSPVNVKAETGVYSDTHEPYIKISWTKNEDADYYIVSYSDDLLTFNELGASWHEETDIFGQTRCTYIDDEVSSGETWYYRVSSVIGDYEGKKFSEMVRISQSQPSYVVTATVP